MSEPKPHSHEERARIVNCLVEMHRRELGANLDGLAAQGSFAREEDREYSDVEIVAFLRRMPGNAKWVDREQIYDGMLVDIVWTTKDEYKARVKEVTPHWHIAGSDHLDPLVNAKLIEEINEVAPRDLRARCLEEACKRWPALHEATTKVLNALARERAPDLGRLVFRLLDHVLVELAFLNAHAYRSSSASLEEALALPEQPPSLSELGTLAIAGTYADRPRVETAVRAVLAELAELLEAKGGSLETAELSLPRLPRGRLRRCVDALRRHRSTRRPRALSRGWQQAKRRLLRSQSAFAMRDVMSLAAQCEAATELGRVYEWYFARTKTAIRTSFGVAAAALVSLGSYVADTDPDQPGSVGAFAAVVVLAAVVGVFQLAELAQLPRELVTASRLLAMFRDLGKDQLKFSGALTAAPEVEERSSRWRPWLVRFVLFVFVIAVVIWAIRTNEPDLVIAGVFVSCVVIPVFLMRVWSEFRPSPEPPPRAERNKHKQDPLAQRIGAYRLDDYISDAEIAAYVDECIEDAAARASSTTSPSGRGSAS